MWTRVGPYGCNAAVMGAGPFALTNSAPRSRRASRGVWSAAAAQKEHLLDLHTAVAVSMLPVSRLRACASFRELRCENPQTTVAHVLDALRVPAHEWSRMEGEARSRADEALDVGATTGMEVVPW